MPQCSGTTKPSNYTELIEATSWKDGSEIRQAGVDVTEVTNAFDSGMSLCVREVYEDLQVGKSTPSAGRLCPAPFE